MLLQIREKVRATIIVAQNNGRVHGLDLLRLLAEKPWEPHKSGSEKRSAVATVLNGRRRRQPAPALGKAVTPYVGVGVLNDVGSFFDTLRDNLETLASLSPEQRSSLFQQPPTVVQAQAADLEAFSGYPAANHHDPGLLWTGLGR
ncbi:unnamed protein product [Leptidea sinapis]|uniref:Uncharacterized protein n=1 Tax=Leptidea sinapis TaxID=189913 RepID=A0A5E4Q6R8_9NEOP|nr:unnamed protein product [Leptidea sinapis]